jgi:hypothetical protein
LFNIIKMSIQYYNDDPNKLIHNSSIITVIFNNDNNVLDVILYQNEDYKYQTLKSFIHENDKHITDLYFYEYSFLLKIYMTKINPKSNLYKKISIDIFNDNIRRQYKMFGILTSEKIYPKLKDIEYQIKLNKHIKTNSKSK